jgi:hypothetical protein
MILQPVVRGDIVAACAGAYLRQSRKQYTLIVDEPFTSKHWARSKNSFEMALEKANVVLWELARITNPDAIMCAECFNLCVLSKDGKRWLCQRGHGNGRVEE